MNQRAELAPAEAGVERMNRTIKEGTVKHYHYDSPAPLRQLLGNFVAACNFDRRLKTLTPCEASCKAWQHAPARFVSNPHHQSRGSSTFDRACSKALAEAFTAAVVPGGADVVFDPVGGDHAEPALRAIAREGRYLAGAFPRASRGCRWT